ncbi:amidohydrolase family protein [Qipengyuania sp.]|uniref:amidohydrolase family protein n=1 Tax=Qipengyuania sp. TaxID=2004515 RepID=UPI0035C7A4D5
MLALCALMFGATVSVARPDDADAFVIRNARIFDGTGAPAFPGEVLVRGDTIVAIARRVERPRGAEVIDARGMTLLPGLHDLHTHLRSPGYDAPEDLGKAYAGQLLRGITTVNDYSVSAEMLAPIREMTGTAGTIPAPHLNLAIRTGVPGGHGTEYGWGDFFTMKAATPRAAHLVMARALPYKPDVIKVFADGWRYDRDPDLNSMNRATLAAIVFDAHAAGIPVVTHTVTLEGAKIAAAAGVDSLVHGVGDALVDDELIALMKRNGTAYVATMVVYEPQQTRKFSAGEWASLSPPEQARERARLARPSEPVAEYDAERWSILQTNVRRIHAAGIDIGIGTDSGIGGVYHGPAAIREIGLLTTLGFTPAQAIVAATRTSARIMHVDDKVGTIAPGMRADMILVDGKPDQTIEDLWNVERVWVSGREAPLRELRKRLENRAMTPLPFHRMEGPIYSGARPDGRSDLDTLPVDASDRGADHSHLDVAHPGTSEDSASPAFALARFGASARPFAQWVLPLTRGGIQLADASGFTGIAFKARGAGDYRLRIESYGIDGSDWFGAGFKATGDSREIFIPFAQFESGNEDIALDLAKLRALRFELRGSPGGTAWLELSDVRFY